MFLLWSSKEDTQNNVPFLARRKACNHLVIFPDTKISQSIVLITGATIEGHGAGSRNTWSKINTTWYNLHRKTVTVNQADVVPRVPIWRLWGNVEFYFCVRWWLATTRRTRRHRISKQAVVSSPIAAILWPDSSVPPAAWINVIYIWLSLIKRGTLKCWRARIC